jgi:hypothetical protein
MNEETLRARVAALYDRNRQQGVAPWCGYEYDFVCPSTGTYPFQWFWDSCFHTIVLSHFDVRRAELELTSLLKNQQPDGFVAHVTFWQREKYEEMLKTYSIAYRTPYLSDCIQPPLLAEALAAVVERGGSQAFFEEMLPKVKRYYDWLDEMRDPDQDGLIATLQPDESGLDHTPKYDAYLGISKIEHAEFTAAWERVAGPYADVGREHAKMFALDKFIVEDVMVNVIYAENQRVLSELLARAGDLEAAKTFSHRAKRTASSILEKCWNPRRGLFFDLAGRAERQLEVSTVSSLFPLLLPELPKEMVGALVAALLDPKEYGAEYPVPTTARSEPTFVPGTVGGTLVWRGPSWINTSWYVARGLRRHGEVELARRIEDASVQAIEKSGFREYYNPDTGEGYGAQGFSWSALVLDMVATRPK